MKVKFFPTQNDFREWFEENHDKEAELLVGFYKVGSGKPSMTWSESVDQALCFGWIDGVRRALNDESCGLCPSQRERLLGMTRFRRFGIKSANSFLRL